MHIKGILAEKFLDEPSSGGVARVAGANSAGERSASRPQGHVLAALVLLMRAWHERQAREARGRADLQGRSCLFAIVHVHAGS